MARIEPVQYEEASAPVREQFDDQISRNGRITNMKKTLLHSLPAFHALMEWYPLRDAAQAFIGERGVNVFCHAISTENDCLICSTFFRKILIDAGEDPDNLQLSEQEALLAEFGKSCVKAPVHVGDALYQQLQRHFTDEQIVILTAFAALMIATNLINTALQVDLDPYLESYARRQ